MINSNFFLITILLCLGVLSGGGADSSQYWKWVNYFQNFEINIFNDLNKSTTGLPLSSWYYGSSIIPSLLNKILLLDDEIAKKINSILVTLLNLFLVRKILLENKIYNLNNISFICLFLIFFPGGYYINKLSSESWTVLFTLASLYFIEKKTKRNLTSETLVIGIFLYFLILIKPTNIFLCISLILIFIIKKINNINYKNIFSKNFFNIYILLFFLILGIILILIYQKILLDNYFNSFYSFGDENVKSFSLRNWKIFEILFSSWHGLFFYHPVYFLLNFYFFFLIFKKNISIELKKIIIVNLLVFLSQIIIQSSWSFWWMGLGTFGARAFAGVSVITFYLLTLIFQKKLIPNNVFLILITFFVVWSSFLLYFGETNFVSYKIFLEKISKNHSIIVIFKLFFISIFILMLKRIYKKNNLFFLNYLLIITSIFLFLSEINSIFNLKTTIYLIVTIFFIYFLFVFVKKKIFIKKIKYLPILLVVILFLSLNLQYKLFNNFNSVREKNYINGVNFNCTDLKGSLEEYENYKKFDDEKKYWKNFFDNNCKTK